MLKKRLIPCLLLKNGRCVKGVQFKDFRDTGHPISNAKIYDSQGADELIFLDINATNEGREPLFDIVRTAAEQCFMPLCAGGGISAVEHIHKMLLAGADKVAINTAAVENPALITEGAKIFGAQCIVVAIDVRKVQESSGSPVSPAEPEMGGKYEVFTHSGTKATGMDPVEWAKKAVSLGAGELLVTSIDHEGMRKGYDLELTRAVADAVNAPVIASGGVGSLQDLVDGITLGHASAVSCGSILHFTDQSVIKAKAYMKNAGLDVRHFRWWK